MCVATGCDYCQSLRGIGLVLARNCVHEASRKVMSSRLKSRSSTTTNATTTTTCSLIGETLKLLFEKSWDSLSNEAKTTYSQNFTMACIMFRHPVVFDPIQGQCIVWNIHSRDEEEELMAYPPYAQIVQNAKEELYNVVGHVYERNLAISVAEGWINPKIWELWNVHGEHAQEIPAHVVTCLRKWKEKIGPKRPGVDMAMDSDDGDDNGDGDGNGDRDDLDRNDHDMTTTSPARRRNNDHDDNGDRTSACSNANKTHVNPSQSTIPS